MQCLAKAAVLTVLAAVLLPICSPVNAQDATGEAESAGDAAKRPQPSAGKLSAPIRFDYTITGNPVVGQAVGVRVEVSSPLTDRDIRLHYRMIEAGSMTFPESQAASTTLAPRADSELRSQQLTLVPQREGRLFIVVSAEVETESGLMMKSMSIPIQVGRATPATLSDDVVEGTDGEPGVSMPSSDPH